MAMKTRKTAMFTAAVAAIIGLAAILLRTTPRAPDQPQLPVQASEQPVAPASEETTNQPAPQVTVAPPPTKMIESDSPEELARIIRLSAAEGISEQELYARLAALKLNDRSWWRTSNQVAVLFEIASDATLAEPYRVMALGVYLAAAPQTQLHENAPAIQQLAQLSSDKMVVTALQGMADRAVAPTTLTKDTLTSASRGTGPKCYAWYAARLTQKNDPELAAMALAAPDATWTEATKVGYDYLASGSFQDQYASNAGFRQGFKDSLLRVNMLQPGADPMEHANGDAFIRALPGILPTANAVETLLSLLRETPNPEMRLSAIEQLVALHLSGAKDLAKELHQVREATSELFNDPVKQDRAKLRLNRVQTKRISP